MAANSIPSVATGQKARPRRPYRDAGGIFYFAYGSNLHVAQMAQRCPESVFKGKATLPAYRWQINQRGVANVVRSADDEVEGLLYYVSPRDEGALDRAEGVSKAFYQRHYLIVTCEPHKRFSGFKSSRLAQLLAHEKLQVAEDQTAGSIASKGSSTTLDESEPKRRDEKEDPGRSWQQIEALVYISENYKDDGKIREEYISRMQKAASDAVTLCVSQSFVDKNIAPFFNDRIKQQATGQSLAREAPNKDETDGGRSNNPLVEAVSGDAAKSKPKLISVT